MEPVVVVTGATASGKSAFAFALMERLQQLGHKPELVNADSVQVYEGCDVGSAKPSPAELSRFPSHLFSTSPPAADNDVSAFQREADAVIKSIRSRGGLPVIVGGTGLYIQVLLNGIFQQPVRSDEREQKIEEFFQSQQEQFRATRSNSAPIDSDVAVSNDEIEWRNHLYGALTELDPYTAENLSPADGVRVRRAIEVFLATGEPLRRLQEQHSHREVRYRALVFYLEPERESLYRSINVRSERMFKLGLLEETRALLEKFGPDVRVLSALGYRHATDVLRGERTLTEAQDLLRRDTRRYAKRQLTWWRNQPVKLGWTILDRQNDHSNAKDAENTIDPQSFESLVVDRACDSIARLTSEQDPFHADSVYFLTVNLPQPWGMRSVREMTDEYQGEW